MSLRDEVIHLNKKYTYFSWSAQQGVEPLAIDRAQGIYLWDFDGKRYTDFSSQLILSNIGHGDERVSRAISDQMTKLHYVQPGFATKARGELGRAIAELTPGDLNKTFFTLGGADGIENAMKMARLYTGRQKVITRYRSFHGGTFAAAAAGGDPRGISVGPGVPWIIHMQDPYSYRSPIYRHCSPEEGDMILCDLLEDTIRLEGPETIAAVLLEGYSGSSGIIAPSTPRYWHRVREICHRHGIVLIVDEVMSGFGRTGKWFGIDHSGVVPDIMVMAKGLTSGYLPLGAVTTNQKIADHFEKNNLACGLTYSGHALSCAAALMVLKIYQDDKLVENASRLGEVVEKKLQLLYDRHPSIGEVRGKGLHWCLELVKNRKTRQELSEWNRPLSEPMAKVSSFLRKKGILAFVRWNQLYLCPPLCIKEEELLEGLEVYSQALKLADEAYG